jgi:amidase
MWQGIGYNLALLPRHDHLADYGCWCSRAPAMPHREERKRGARRTRREIGENRLRGELQQPAPAEPRPHNPHLPRIAGCLLQPRPIAAEAQVLSPENQSLSAYGLRGLTICHPGMDSATRERVGLRARWQALFQDIDVLVCPPMPTVAFPQDQSEPQEDWVIDIDGKKVPYDNQMAWCAIATPTGLPVTVMPIGHDERGLPIGVQIVGGFLEDKTTLKFAELIEREFGGLTRRRIIKRDRLR